MDVRGHVRWALRVLGALGATWGGLAAVLSDLGAVLGDLGAV